MWAGENKERAQHGYEHLPTKNDRKENRQLETQLHDGSSTKISKKYWK